MNVSSTEAALLVLSPSAFELPISEAFRREKHGRLDEKYSTVRLLMSRAETGDLPSPNAQPAAESAADCDSCSNKVPRQNTTT